VAILAAGTSTEFHGDATFFVTACRDFAQYISERPELTPKDLGVKEGQNNKEIK
jgi:hypothetical protein